MTHKPTMKTQITGITEADVVRISALLDEGGFAYDVDYTTLYGAGWAVVGIECTNAAAAQVVAAQVAEITADAFADGFESGIVAAMKTEDA